ncbi:plant U-box 24 [Euphorbia peplus]|nr:plant U-box 24 [Euphorbia peplus]
MDDIEIPKYYLCPISLQIMKDPVTTITGITYDRESIEQWLKTTGKNSPTCPVTNQPLPTDSGLTPNHMLRRIIQAWCVANAKNGVDQIPTPKSPVSKSFVRKLIRDLNHESLKKLEELAMENERNVTCIAEAGATKALVSFVVKCFQTKTTHGLEEALRVLYVSWTSSQENKNIIIKDNSDFIDSLTWFSQFDIENHVVIKTYSILVLRKAIEYTTTTSLVERLRPEFFQAMVGALNQKMSQQAVKSALRVLIEVCPFGRNRTKIVEAEAVFALIELELEKPEKKVTDLIFNLLAQLCSCANGREQLMKHAGSIAMISKRILRVSAATDDRALNILGLISKFSASNEIVAEMLRVGAVTKLCMVIQADCASYLKHIARDILRLHSNVWNNSPCIAVYLLTRYPNS